MVRLFTILLISFLLLFVVCGENLYNLNYDSPRELFQLGKQYFVNEDYSGAQIIFGQLVRLNIVADYSDSAQYLLAESYYNQEDYLLAQSEYERLIANLPRSPLLVHAKYKIGMCYYEISPSLKYDQESTYEAIQAFEEFLADPQSQSDEQVLQSTKDRLAELNEKLALKDLRSARLYKKMNDLPAALQYFDEAMNNYNTYGHVSLIPDALFEKGECYIKLNDFSSARETFQALIDNFPEHHLVSRAREKLSLLEHEIAKQDTTLYEF